MAVSQPLTSYGIALGSNLGDRPRNLEEAIERLLEALPGGCLVARSSFYETEPVDCAPGTRGFLNGVIEVASTLRPHAMLEVLAGIEVAMGRPADHGHHEPRTVDLDMLYAGDWTSDDPQLTIPHPRMHERRFVLAPLAEIRPELVLPGFEESVAILLDQLNDDPSSVRPVCKEA